jgi:hypothetical protein
MANLLDAKIIFQSHRNFDPSLRHALVFYLVIVVVVVVVVVVVGAGFGDVFGIFIKLLDILQGSAPASEERLGGHGPDAIDARELPQDLVLFIFKKGLCVAFGHQRKKVILENSLVSLI